MAQYEQWLTSASRIVIRDVSGRSGRLGTIALDVSSKTGAIGTLILEVSNKKAWWAFRAELKLPDGSDYQSRSVGGALVALTVEFASRLDVDIALAKSDLAAPGAFDKWKEAMERLGKVADLAADDTATGEPMAKRARRARGAETSAAGGADAEPAGMADLAQGWREKIFELCDGIWRWKQ